MKTSEEKTVFTPRTDGLWVEPHRKEFIKRLSEQGYSKSSIQIYEVTLRRFNEEIEKRNIGTSELDNAMHETVKRSVVSRTGKTIRKYAKFCIQSFINYLISEHIIIQFDFSVKESTPLDLLKEEYKSYLHNQRGLKEITIEMCLGHMEKFLKFHFAGKEVKYLDRIKLDDIVEYILHLKNKPGAFKHKSLPSHLRNFFSFLFWSGKTKANLADKIPKVSQRGYNQLPGYIKQKDIEYLLAALKNNPTSGMRNYAMFLLLARLGLRSNELLSIQLDDINWRTGEILIRGKGNYHDYMPITPDIGEAIVEYIKKERKGTSRVLFVSSVPPFNPFSNSSILTIILGKIYKNTYLKSPRKYAGVRMLRHTLAVNMLKKGVSLDEVSKVLRHRSQYTTTIYAKHDINALNSITLPWPL
jgi:integrase/recombinase XerD